MDPLRVGLIGCGNISGIYLENLTKFPKTDVVAIADMDMARAQSVAEKYGVRAVSVDELLNDSQVELIVNLTVPLAHYDVDAQAIQAGKHVYTEKPLATRRKEGEDTLAQAQAKGVLVGCAPDTFLGAGLQTCREIIESGKIGTPFGFNAFMMGHGPEDWHPSPEFFYQHGGGPMFDMGPYYLTALVHLLGPVATVTGVTKTTFAERVIGSEAKRGQVMNVETPTHLIGLLEFQKGAVGQITTSFDVWGTKYFNLEIYGTEGAIGVPDPNTFGGPVYLRKARSEDWEEVEITRPYSQNSRGLGILDMAHAIRTGRPHRASGSLACHVLDVMQSVIDSGASKSRIEVANQTEQPAALAASLPENDLDG